MSPAVARILFAPPWARRDFPRRHPAASIWFDFSDYESLTRTSASFAGTGTATSTLVSAAVVGVGTAFAVELAAGDMLYTAGDVLIGTIATVTDATNATLTGNAATAITGAAFKIVKANPRISAGLNRGVMASAGFTQATAAKMPQHTRLNDRWGALFDGTDDHVKTGSLTLPQPLTVMLALTPLTWVSGKDWTDGLVGNSMLIEAHTGTPKFSPYAGSFVGDVSFALNSTHVATAVFSGTSSSFRRNLDAPVTGSAGTAAPGGFVLGANNDGSRPTAIHVNEAIVFTRALAPEEQTPFIRYLNRKFRLGM